MKRLFRTYHFWIKILSGLCLVLLPVLSLSGLRTSSVLTVLAMSETGAISILLMLPLPDEDARQGMLSSAVLFSVLLFCHFVGVHAGYAIAFCLFVVLLRMVSCFRLRFSAGRAVLKAQFVWYAMQSHVRLIYALLLGELAGLSVLLSASGWAAVPVALLALMYVFPFLESERIRILLLGRERERTVRQMFCCEKQDSVPPDRPDGNAAMYALYEKVTCIMDSKRPYLDEDYSLNDLSFAAYTNKTYLSRTINVMSGKNFRQFINSYRIRYSVELMKKNPRLRMDEVATMSGFHSTVTFTMAFKANMGETPGEYAQRLKSNLV